MATLKFSSAAVHRLMRHVLAAQASAEPGQKSEDKSSLVLVTDVGIYLMSDGTHRLLLADGNPFVVYAEGYDPAEFSSDLRALRVKCREAVGGDDFSLKVDLNALPTPDDVPDDGVVTIRLTANEMSVSVSR